MRGTPKLVKRKDTKYWYIQFYNGVRSTRISTDCEIGKDDAKAQQKLSEFLQGWSTGQSATAEQLNCHGVLDAWFNTHGNTLASSKASSFSINAFKAFYPPDAGPQYVADHWNRYVEWRGVAPSTIKREAAIVKAAYKRAMERGQVHAIPNIKPPQSGEARDRWLTPEDITKLLDACVSDHVRLYIQVALNTGARREAIQELTWKQVDLEGGVIRFNPHGRTQNNKKRAVVPINSYLMQILKDTPRESEYLIHYKGKGNIDIRRAWERTVKRSGLEDVQSRDLRRTAGVRMAQAGVDLWDIASVLGHTDIKTTYKHYAPYSPDHSRKAVEVLGQTSPESAPVKKKKPASY